MSSDIRPPRHPRGFPSGILDEAASQPGTAYGVSPAKLALGRRAGFATILVLMLLFMMLIMVISYLRVMRSYALTHAQITRNGQEVLGQLETDLAVIIGADGKIGPTAKQTGGQTDVEIHEPSDYPWTCTTQFRNTCELRYPNYRMSKQGMGDPYLDDSWLAPLEPSGATWSQVSNPMGSFLVYADATLAGIPKNAQTGEFVPMDAPAGAAIPNMANGQFVSFQNLPTTDARLVDTDGDGVGDALWFYPKDNVRGGLRYAAAVRVVDLSGCLNLNTALGDLSTAPGSSAGTPRKGEGPYEIKAASLDPSLALDTNVNSKTFRSSSGPATSWNFWRVSGAQTANDGTSAVSNRYGLSDEALLRDLSGKLTASGALNPMPRAFTTGAVTGDYGALPAGSLRQKLTLHSGAADRAAPPPFSGSGSYSWGSSGLPCNYYTGRTHRAGDLNLYQMDSASSQNGQWWNSTLEDYFYFYSGDFPGMEELFNGVDSTTTADDYPFPEGFKALVPTASNRSREYQIQMGACLQDAMERDNRPSMTWNWTGWKPLPIMTEFYVQMPYVVEAPYQTPWNTNNTLASTSSGSSSILVFPGETCANLTQVHLRNLNIQYNNTAGAIANVYFFSRPTASTITAQFQAVRSDWGPRTECWKIKFADSAQGVTMQLLWGKAQMASSVPLGTDFETQPDGGPWQSDVKIGLPPAAGSNWNQGYINTVKDRTAADASMAPTSGQYSGYGDPRTSTDWRATGIAGVGSYAFELANPYAIPIRLNNLRIRFRANDRSDWSAISGLTANPAAAPSQDLSTFITASTGLAQDAEGYYVLKPGERIVFYRNGLELSGPAGARRRPMGGPAYVGAAPTPGVPSPTDISPLIATGAGIYKVDLGAANTAPDINGYPGNWGCVSTIDLEVNCKNNAGGNWGWLPYNHMVFQAPTSGYDQNHCYRIETNVPNQYQAAPGDLVYLQQDVRTFGSEEKLNLLQARPASFPFADVAKNIMPVDLGDVEWRTNTYAFAGSGVLPNGSAKVYPNPASGVFGGFSAGNGYYDNTTSTMPLGHPASGMTYLSYDSTSGTSRVSALGQSAKVSFRTPLGGPNGGNAMYGGQRQDIRDGSLFFNYVGIPSDPANYPGTFPELMSAPAGPWTSATSLARDNPTANSVNGPQRRDGTPRTMDISKIMMAGPIWWNFSTGNNSYRGTTVNGGWGGGSSAPATPTVDQLTSWYQYTIGDAVNFHLAKDRQVNGTNAKGLKGLCLRDDVPFYDPAKIAHALLAGKSLDQLYADLDAKQAALDAYNTANPIPPSGPDPNAATRAAFYQDLATIRAGIRGMANWRMSWAGVIANYFQVDSPKYKGYMGTNGQDFKPGTVNLNTASKEVLACLSFPAGTNVSAFCDGIIAARQSPKMAFTAPATAGAPVVIPKNDNSAVVARQGIAFIDELRNQGFAAFGTPDAKTLGDTLAWLPQQASCRSDVFCAYIIVQGYQQSNFNLGPMDSRRALVIYSRGTSGAPAAKLKEYILSSN